MTTNTTNTADLRAALIEARDWFESQAKAVSKGCGSSYELNDLRMQRDALDAALAAPAQAVPSASVEQEAMQMLWDDQQQEEKEHYRNVARGAELPLYAIHHPEDIDKTKCRAVPAPAQAGEYPELPERPEPDGFLTIKIIGRNVEINAYRDSTMEAYAYASIDADRAARGAAQALDARWVSAKDRLPDPFCEVLIHPRPTDYCCEGSVNTQGEWSYGEYEHHFGHNSIKCNVTHWMPLPTPPVAIAAKQGVK